MCNHDCRDLGRRSSDESLASLPSTLVSGHLSPLALAFPFEILQHDKVETDALFKPTFSLCEISPGERFGFWLLKGGMVIEAAFACFDLKFQMRRLIPWQLDISRELGAFLPSEVFGDSVALHVYT